MCSRNDLAEHLITDDTHKYYERNKPYIAWPAVLSNSGSPLTMRKKVLNRFIIYTHPNSYDYARSWLFETILSFTILGCAIEICRLTIPKL
jgi:hypothetical protein